MALTSAPATSCSAITSACSVSIALINSTCQNGKISYSRIIAIDRGESAVTLEVYPNPKTAEMSLRVGNRIEEVNVYNNTAHLVLHQVDGKTILQVSSLSGGVYRVEIKTVIGLILRQHFIKQ